MENDLLRHGQEYQNKVLHVANQSTPGYVPYVPNNAREKLRQRWEDAQRLADDFETLLRMLPEEMTKEQNDALSRLLDE